MALTKFPCKDCPDRKPACQSRCEKYLEAKAAHEELKEKIRKMKAAENDVGSFLVAACIKNSRR